MQECLGYFARLWEERRANPGHDLVSMLVHGEATKEMPPAAHLGNLLLLIVGGNDTTRNTMSGSVYALNQFPEEYVGDYFFMDAARGFIRRYDIEKGKLECFVVCG